MIILRCILRVSRYQTNMAREVLETVSLIQPKEANLSNSETREDIIYRIANEMLEKMPPDYRHHEVTHTPP